MTDTLELKAELRELKRLRALEKDHEDLAAMHLALGNARLALEYRCRVTEVHKRIAMQVTRIGNIREGKG